MHLHPRNLSPNSFLKSIYIRACDRPNLLGFVICELEAMHLQSGNEVANLLLKSIHIWCYADNITVKIPQQIYFRGTTSRINFDFCQVRILLQMGPDKMKEMDGFFQFVAQNPCICILWFHRPTGCQNPFTFNPTQSTSLAKFPRNPVSKVGLNSRLADSAWICDLCVRTHSFGWPLYKIHPGSIWICDFGVKTHAFASQDSVCQLIVKIQSHSTLLSQHHCESFLAMMLTV